MVLARVRGSFALGASSLVLGFPGAMGELLESIGQQKRGEQWWWWWWSSYSWSLGGEGGGGGGERWWWKLAKKGANIVQLKSSHIHSIRWTKVADNGPAYFAICFLAVNKTLQ